MKAAERGRPKPSPVKLQWGPQAPPMGMWYIVLSLHPATLEDRTMSDWPGPHPQCRPVTPGLLYYRRLGRSGTNPAVTEEVGAEDWMEGS